MLFVHGLGHFHPENVITNAFLESLDIGTDTEWILERVGIRERRTVLPLDYIRATRNADVRAAREAALYDNAETGARAARLAIERSGIPPEEIGLVISGGCGSDYAIPGDAARIADRLGLRAAAVDLSAASSSFGAQLHFLAAFRAEAMPDFVLLVQPENTTRMIDYCDRDSCVLWGDGAAAAVMSSRVPSRVRVDLTSVASNPAGWDKVTIPTAGHFRQDGRAVQTFAIKTMRDLVAGIRARVAKPLRLKFVGHQGNMLMLQSVCRYCGIPEDRHMHNVGNFGNTGAAGAPAVLSQAWETLQDGDEIAVAVVGSGLTWSGLRLTVGGAA
jgi:3-oxoacyl-[acyl-carrier-protein] synthase III